MVQNNNDMWGVIQAKVGDINNPKWFVPSRAEWAAFGDMAYTKMGVTASSYSNYGLRDIYWSSVQYDTNRAYSAYLYDGHMSSRRVNNYSYVRLSATF